MKRLLTIIVFMLTAVVAVNAQGSVTISQSSEIDALVNGKKAQKKNDKSQKKVENQDEAARPTIRTSDTKRLVVPKIEDHKPEITRPDNSTLQPIRTKVVKHLVRRPHIPSWDETEDTRIVTKHIRKGTQRVRGFRVQVYNGGNTRIAHQQTDRAGQKAKKLFPDQPVYVHFYPPRWMCLVGNFTNYNAAKKIIRTLHKEGYPHASVIRMMVAIKTAEPVGF